VKQAFGYRAGSSVYGPFGSKFADDEHSSTSLSLKSCTTSRVHLYMIEIDLALTREAAGHRSGCAVCATTSYYAQLRSLNLSTGPRQIIATSNERSVVDTQCPTPHVS
jgi:hypothetical protein